MIEGELFKLGQRTNIMQSRYGVLRDNTLFLYANKSSQVPLNLIFLPGTYTNTFHSNIEDELFSFIITTEQKGDGNQSSREQSSVFYHRNQNMIFHWVKELQKHGKSASFDHFYSKGRKLGSGKFSTVY